MTTMTELMPRSTPDTSAPRENLPATSRAYAQSIESIPSHENQPASTIRRQYEGFLVTENPQTGRFNANVTFRLSGVALNGCSVLSSRPNETSLSATRLLAKLFHETASNTSVESVFAGGGRLEFSWGIYGRIHDPDSEDAAARQAEALRQSLLLVLASDPAIRFANTNAGEQSTSEPALHQSVHFEPKPICLDVPQSAPLGFSRSDITSEALSLRLPRPSRITRSFNSVAELVADSPVPVRLSVSMRRFDLTPEQLQRLTDALTWIRRSPVAFLKQLANHHLDSSASGIVEATLKRWIESPQGVKLNCRAVSDSKVTESLLRVIGSEVLGCAVNVVGPKTPIEPESATRLAHAEQPAVLALEGCVPVGASLPQIFPAATTFLRVQVRRHYNVHSPDLDSNGLLLGSIAETGLQSVHLDHAARNRHVYVLGATGTGKSTLMANMIHQDIREGRGVCLIDPHGDLYDQIVESLPLNRAKDVVLFNPSLPDAAPGLNILECTGPNRSRQVSFAINELLKILKRMYEMPEAFGPMFETYFRNALLLLLESDLPAVTLMELSLIFESKTYRQFLLGRCRNPIVVGFWKEIAEKACGESSLANIAPYITCKLNSFTHNAVIRPIIGQARSTMDFRNIMDRQKVLLVKLPKGLLGESDSQLLGSFILSRLFAVAMSRADIPDHKRRAFHLYVDEFQNFVNDSASFMLAEARKYGLHLTLANQNLSQLAASTGRQNVLEAVLGNVGSLISFRVGAPDADKLRLYTEPEFGALELQGLPNYHAVARIMTSRGPTRPFVFATLPASWNRRRRRVNPVVWQLRERANTSSIAEVEAAIAERRNWARTIGGDSAKKEPSGGNPSSASAGSR